MKNFTDNFTLYEAALNLTPEQKKRRAALKQKRKEWIAKGKDVSSIDAELAQIEGGAVSPSTLQPQAGNPKAPTSKPGPLSNDPEAQKGYNDAIEAIKKAKADAKSGKMQQGSGSSNSGGGNGLAPIPLNPEDFGDQQPGTTSQGQPGQTRDGKQEGQGVVRPEDCAPPAGANSIAKTPGAMGGIISKSDGDKLAESEGYDKSSGSESAIAKDWAERAKRAASKMAGKGAGYEKFKAKLDALYRTTKDWKKELKMIVGHAISPDDKRSAYANKNILISQDRIARTDKDKYDNIDYMMAWIDTSGSMSQEYLNQCLCEVYQVALAKKPVKLVIVQFDTRIADIQEFTSVADLKRKMNSYTIKGGGGTEVKPCFDMLIKDRKYNRRPAEIVMIFTDGYLDQYKRNPRTMRNLVWVVVDNTSFDLKYKDANTKCVRISSKDLGR